MAADKHWISMGPKAVVPGRVLESQWVTMASCCTSCFNTNFINMLIVGHHQGETSLLNLDFKDPLFL